MNFELTQDQQMLAEAVRQFVKKESPVSRFRALRDEAQGWDPKMWKRFAEQGWLGVLYPESVGGFEGTFVDMMLLLETMGTQLVPEPIIESAVLGGLPILFAGNADQQQRYLAPMIAGDESLALAHAEADSRFTPSLIGMPAVKAGAAWKLNGEKRFVPNGHAAEHIVVAARTAGKPGDTTGVSLFIVPRNSPGLTVHPLQGMDGRKYARLSFADTPVTAENLLGAADAALPVLERVLDYGAAALCCEGAGLSRQMLDMTVEYLQTRQQFGVPIGSFQALQHRAVDMFVETELCKSTAILAAIQVENADAEQRKQAVSAAKVQLALGGRFVSQQATQLHGGIGVTDEHDLGLYFKRMHILNTLCGDERYHTLRFADSPLFLSADDTRKVPAAT